MLQNVVTRLEEPTVRSLRIIRFSDEYINCRRKVVDCIIVKVFYLAKSSFFKKELELAAVTRGTCVGLQVPPQAWHDTVLHACGPWQP